MRRRDFLTILGGAAALAPLNAGAQEARIRRIGVLFVYGEDHPEAPSFVGALKEGLQSRGWIQGQTIHMEFRYCRSDPKLVQRYTDELVGLKPDIIFAQGVVGAAAMKHATQTIPVVFAQVQDPVGGGFVTNLARPEGNLTGFTNFEYSIVGKWLQLLKLTSLNEKVCRGEERGWDRDAQFGSRLDVDHSLEPIRGLNRKFAYLSSS